MPCHPERDELASAARELMLLCRSFTQEQIEREMAEWHR